MAWLKSQAALYWLLFVGTFLAVAVWETWRPRAPLAHATQRRWGIHAAILALSIILQNVLLRVSPVVLAAMVAGSPYGLLNRAWMPGWLRFAAALLLLDLTHYGTHRAFHSVGLLWRVHEVHHSDPDYDVSTAGRFHPLEVVGTQGATLLAVALLAPPPLAVFAAALIAVVLNLVAHANAALPAELENWLRRALITPDLHRIHHSEEVAEQSRNFGQTFSWWDRLFGTFLGGAARGERHFATGIKELRGDETVALGFLLTEPFRRRPPVETDPVLEAPGPPPVH